MSESTRERRSYGMQCGLAYALDVIGERWTLLIVRELLVAPRRYGELLDALPGIGTNLLADRLRSLTEAGVLAEAEPGRRTAGYVLTPLGESLREPVLGLARFGLNSATEHPPPRATTATRPSWAILAIEAMLDQDQVPPVDEVYEFEIDGAVFHIETSGGRAHTRSGPAATPTLTMRTDVQTFFDLGLRRLDPIEAVVSGSVTVQGVSAAVPRCLRLIGLARPEPTVRPQRPPTS